jgi:hypothetical protein
VRVSTDVLHAFCQLHDAAHGATELATPQSWAVEFTQQVLPALEGIALLGVACETK